MSTQPAPAWDVVPIFGTYRNLDGTPKTGKIKFTLSERVVDNTDDVIFPGGGSMTVQLGAESGSFRVEFPASDDPDVSPNGWEVKVEEQLTDSSGKIYYIQPTIASLPDGINLRKVIIPPDAPAAPPPAFMRGVKGGIAALDAETGEVLDAAGDPVVSSVNGETGAVTVVGATDASVAGIVADGAETSAALTSQYAPQRPDRAPKVDAPLLVTTPITVTKGLTVSMTGYDEARGIYYGTSKVNGHYNTSTDAETWTDQTYSPSTYTPSTIGWQFDETYHYAFSDSGRVWRAALGVFNAWTEITPSDVPSGTTGRPGSLCALGNGVLLYGNYNVTPVDGSHIWRSTDAGVTWAHVVDNPSGKHIHAIRRSPHTGTVWATVGDYGFQGAGLWKSTDDGATWAQMATNDYGIDMVFYPAIGGRPPLVIMEGDGLNRPLLMGFWEDGQPGDKVFPLTWFSGAPSDPNSTRGTVRGIALNKNLDVLFFTTTEGGAVGSKSGLYIAQGPDFTNTKLLYDTTGAEPAAYQRTTFTDTTAYNYIWKFPIPKFATY